MIELLCALAILCTGLVLGVIGSRLLREVRDAKDDCAVYRGAFDALEQQRAAERSKLGDIERTQFALNQDLETLWKARADKRYGQRTRKEET